MKGFDSASTKIWRGQGNLPPVSNGPFMVHDKSFSSLVRGKKIRFKLKAKTKKEIQLSYLFMRLNLIYKI